MPKALLKQWKVPGPKYEGIHCYERESGQTTFYSSGGPRGYSFAVGKDLYIPDVDGERILSVEQWLGGQEDVMGRVLGKMRERSPQPYRDEEERITFYMALLSLQHRTKQRLEILERHINEHPDIRVKIEDELGESDQFVLLENMINVITEEAIALSRHQIVVTCNPKGKLLICDEPFLGDGLEDEAFISCSPYFFLSITNQGLNKDIVYADCDDNLVHAMNKLIAANGQYWIAGMEKSIVEKYIEEFEQPKTEGKIVFDWLRYIPNGYRIKKN